MAAPGERGFYTNAAKLDRHGGRTYHAGVGFPAIALPRYRSGRGVSGSRMLLLPMVLMLGAEPIPVVGLGRATPVEFEREIGPILTAKCAGCHSERIGETPAEATLVNDYIKPGRETPWLVYSQQPKNVWFSHAIHVKRAKLACVECHSTYGESDQVRVLEVNRISGYSRDIWGHSISRLRRAPHDGMKMSDCEDCHQRHNIEVGCLGCHQ